jgi:hypothetical protein
MTPPSGVLAKKNSECPLSSFLVKAAIEREAERLAHLRQLAVQIVRERVTN